VNQSGARPLLPGIAENSPVTMAAWHFAAHMLFLRLLLESSVCVYSGAMEDTAEGLTEKLYWRRARGEWHCFRKLAQVRGFVSLCQRQEIALVLGQQISRPEAHLRCGLCDGLEMARRGWDGSGPVSPRRAGSFSRLMKAARRRQPDRPRFSAPACTTRRERRCRSHRKSWSTSW
jgi:hypothetical protein